MRNNKWKKICSCMLAVCLVGTLFFANQSSGVFAEEKTQLKTEVNSDMTKNNNTNVETPSKTDAIDKDENEKVLEENKTQESVKNEWHKEVSKTQKTDNTEKKKKRIAQTITDRNKKVTISGKLPENTIVKVNTLTAEKIKKLNLPDKKIIFAYDIKLYADGKEYQPELPVKVNVLKHEKVEKDITVTHIETNKNGKTEDKTKVKSDIKKNGTVEFTAESFSYYVGTEATQLEEYINADEKLLSWKAEKGSGTASVTFDGATYNVTDESSYNTAYKELCKKMKDVATVEKTEITEQTIDEDTIWNVSGIVSMTGNVNVTSKGRLVILGDGTITRNGDYAINTNGTIALQDNVTANGGGTTYNKRFITGDEGKIYLSDNFKIENFSICNSKGAGIYGKNMIFYMSGGIIGSEDITISWDDGTTTKYGEETESYLKKREIKGEFPYLKKINSEKGCRGRDVDPNSAAPYGGGVALENSTFYMSDGSIVGNSLVGECSEVSSGRGSHGAGGDFKNSNIHITGGKISANQSAVAEGASKEYRQYAGAIQLEQGSGGVYECNISNTEVAYNYSQMWVGGIDIYSGNKLTFGVGAVAKYNCAESNSGAIAIDGTGSQMEMLDGCKITHNYAGGLGGGIRCLGKLTMNGGEISYNKSEGNAAGLSIQTDSRRGEAVLNSGSINNNYSLSNGGGMGIVIGIYGDKSSVVLNGTNVYNNTAKLNGGGFFVDANRGEVTADLNSGGIINNYAENGGGVYIQQSNEYNCMLNISSDEINIKNNMATKDGGGVYLYHTPKSEGTVETTIDNGNINENEAKRNGGGLYLNSGNLRINNGSIRSNHAYGNGAGAYVSDGKIRMFGGSITDNQSDNSGGGMYVSSTNQAADVVIRSGKLINNSAESSASDQGNGGAIAVVSSNSANADRVIIGLREKHPGLDTTKRTFTAFDYKDDKDDNAEHNHASCPEISGNTASGNGGGIYMSSSKSILDIYCLMEEKNTAEKDTTGGSIMSVGGNVNIGDIGNDGNGNNTEDAVGNIFIQSPMLVKGGNVKIYGNTDNPKFADKILVDMRKDAGTFNDYRYTMAAVGDNINYKIEYFENFEGSGAFTSMQYSKSAKITAMGNMYIHEGYKIVGWDTQADGKGTRYQIGNLIASADDHSAWNGKGDKEALRLYAIWEKVSYTVVYDPNAEKYSGKMPSEQFTYNVQKKLSDNVYKVDGKRFVNWNTKADGKGTTYESSYNESKMTNKDGATITLYAQWVECTHLGGDHPGNVSYTVDDLTHRILTETCDCGGHTASVAISGADVYYDGKEHLASLNYTNTFLAGNQQITYTYKANASDPSYGSMPEGTTVPKNIGYYRASITVKGQTAYVEYQIKSPAEAATIDAAAIKGQYFKNFNGKSTCAVTKDDAFTVQYDVQKLNEGTNEGANKAYKTAPVLTLSQSLPEGTTVIMQTGDKYWYYQQSSGNSGTEIALSSFTKMGTTSAKFTYSTSNIENTQMYRFVVDFSKVSGVSLGGDLQIGLKYAYTNPTTGASETSQDKEKKIMVSLNDASVFKVSPSGNECTVTAPSTVTDTRWERKNLVWKIKPAKANVVLPSDAKLTLSTTEGGSVKTAIYALNTNGEFIIPFTWTGSQKFTFSLSSSQESAVKSYDLTANLCVGSKVNGTTQPKAQEDDLEKASADISLTVPVDAAPAVKITGVKDAATGVGAERVFSNKDTLNVNITTANVDGCKIQAIIQKKADGTYKGEYYKSENVSAGSHSFSLQSTDGAGSYRLLLTVSSATGQTLLEVPYYFIVQ